jgi:hypothetical protein
MKTVSVSRVASAPAAAVIDALWSGAEWRASWNGIASFDIDYDDGEHQAARLVVDWNGEARTLSLVRFREGPGEISFFCPDAPAPLSRQTGRWSAVQASAFGSVVTATRQIEIAGLPGESEAEREARLDAYAAELQSRLVQILDGFSARVAADAQDDIA